MRSVTRTVPHPPRVKARPRLGRRGKVFTPQATVDAEHLIADAFEGVAPFEGPVSVRVDYYKHKQVITITETVGEPMRGDLDNYVKLTLDGLQRADVLPNDRQVVRIAARSRR